MYRYVYVIQMCVSHGLFNEVRYLAIHIFEIERTFNSFMAMWNVRC